MDGLYARRRPAVQPGPPRKSKKSRRRLPVYLSKRERDVLLEAARRSSPRGVPLGALRDTALISVAALAGLRVAELAALDRVDVDLDELTVHVRHGKGDKPRVVPLHLDAAVAIDEYLRARTDDDPAMFLSRRGQRASIRTLRNIVYRVAAEAKLTKRISPHKLRHTFATLLYDASGDIFAVKEALGHEDLSTTEIYTHVSTSRMRAGIDQT